MAERRKGGGGTGDVQSAVDMFSKMADSMSKMFTAVNELRSSVSIGSMVSDFETIAGAINKLKNVGAEKGEGSLEDKLATAFITGIVNRVTGGKSESVLKKEDAKTDKSEKKGTETGAGKVEEIEQ